MEALLHTCQFRAWGFNRFEKQFVNESIYDIIQDMAPSIDGTLKKCRWKSVNVPCSDLFEPIFTSQGLCFSFNALNSEEIFTDKCVEYFVLIEFIEKISREWKIFFRQNHSCIVDDQNQSKCDQLAYWTRLYRWSQSKRLSASCIQLESEWCFDHFTAALHAGHRVFMPWTNSGVQSDFELSRRRTKNNAKHLSSSTLGTNGHSN